MAKAFRIEEETCRPASSHARRRTRPRARESPLPRGDRVPEISSAARSAPPTLPARFGLSTKCTRLRQTELLGLGVHSMPAVSATARTERFPLIASTMAASRAINPVRELAALLSAGQHQPSHPSHAGRISERGECDANVRPIRGILQAGVGGQSFRHPCAAAISPAPA
jgi:hypothetical protein